MKKQVEVRVEDCRDKFGQVRFVREGIGSVYSVKDLELLGDGDAEAGILLVKNTIAQLKSYHLGTRSLQGEILEKKRKKK